jgi:hypothetical protein
MIGLLADENFGGHAERSIAKLQSAEWLDVWNEYGFRYCRFEDSGLVLGTKDSVLFRFCQIQRLVLLTANRNGDGEESLDAVLHKADELSLPVATIANPDRVLNDATYINIVAAQLMEILVDIVDRPASILGSGRIFLPRRPF